MNNVNKLLLVIEELQFGSNGSVNDNERIKLNLQIIKKYIKINFEDLQDCQILKSINYVCKSENTTELWKYVSYLIYIVLSIKSECNLDSLEKDDLLSMNQQRSLIDSIVDISKYGVRLHLHDSFSNHRVFSDKTVNVVEKPSFNPDILKVCLEFFQQIFEYKLFASSNGLEPVNLELMAGIFSFYEAVYCNSFTLSDDDKQKFTSFLNLLWHNAAKDMYFKNLLLFKSNMCFTSKLHKQLHKDLLHKLVQPRGFGVLVSVLCGTGSQTKEIVPNWKRFDVIAKIVANERYIQSFNNSMIEQIFQYLRVTLKDETLRSLAPAGILTLRRMHDLKNENRNEIKRKLNEILKCLISPEDILTGAVVMDSNEFVYTLDLLFTCFCISSVESLPSEIIVENLSLFLNVYSQLPRDIKESSQISSIIVRCFNNLKSDQLGNALREILLEKAKITLHPRNVVKFNKDLHTFSIQIASEELCYNYEPTIILPEVLKNSNHNILIYNIFIELLQILDEMTRTKYQPDSIELLQNLEEVDCFIKKNFKGRLTVISVLTDLLTHKNVHSQFHDNPTKILDFVQKQIEKTIQSTNMESEIEQQDHLLSLSLAILQEILETSSNHEKFKDFCKILKSYHQHTRNVAIQHQVKNLIFTIEGGERPFSSIKYDQSHYSFARNLIEEKQPHLRVYGMTQMIKLLKEKNDETIANRHAVLALAIHALHDDESYTYLNCVRLFVALINELEDDVLETLSSEFLNANEKVDYRLKVGEAIVKVTEYLGPISYKYKNILINCFLHGCQQPIDEFRCSSFSNLATICKLLTFQVHSFFHELMSMIESSVQTESYVPAKRAAVMVLSELLQGMDNLIDFEEFLLPIYRLLNSIVSMENDTITRVHATNALKSLSEKCKKFLFPEQKMEKDINIFSINDTQFKRKQNAHILELN